jgi:peroxiredoxin Q/BCP
VECQSLRASGIEIGKFRVALFAISTDTVDMNRAYAQHLGVDYPLLSDPTMKVARAYGVASPGIARWTFYIGLDGTILYIDKNVMPTSHGKAIVAKLAELGIPKRRGG